MALHAIGSPALEQSNRRQSASSGIPYASVAAFRARVRPAMPFQVGPEITPLVGRVRIALGLTQKQLGEMFQVSMRTAHRWEGGQAYPDVDQVKQLARAVFPTDPRLAADLAREAGTTPQTMGLVPAPMVVPAEAAAPVAPRPFPPLALMIDSILLAAVDAANGQTTAPVTRQAVRDILRAGFSRARGLGLTIDEVDDELRPSAVAKGTLAKK
jgi:transcriptional regulator with XRE-family HTH domain